MQKPTCPNCGSDDVITQKSEIVHCNRCGYPDFPGVQIVRDPHDKDADDISQSIAA